MAERKAKLKSLGRSTSTESTEYSITMGKSVRKKSKRVKPKERWLLTRKTWRYMTDAGKKLIPDGAQNRPEDIPKIEAYFQEVCKKEPRFLLWRKNSYPGALSFKKKRKVSRKGGSCRKATSADEVSLGRPERPTHLDIKPTSFGKFDVKKMKEEFLNKDSPSTMFSSYDKEKSGTEKHHDDQEESQLANMLEQYLRMSDKDPQVRSHPDFNYQDLVEKLQRHLTLSNRDYGSNYTGYIPRQTVHFQGDHVQKSLTDTLSRYFGHSGNRDKIISDLLTNRKALEKLYFELRKAKGFRGSRGGTGYTTSFAYGPQRSNYENTSKDRNTDYGVTIHPPPLIEVQSETVDIIYRSLGTQTLPIPEAVLVKVEEDYKKSQEEKREEEEVVKEIPKPTRRRSSVDNDDISQSVSDTIKRYLRMARKKSVDTDKVDRFKRVNYDRNLRNIKAKGETTKPGDDDGLNKGCQTNDDWILTYRDLKFADVYDVSDSESRFSSSRSSIDIGMVDGGALSTPSSPPTIKSSQSFLSHLLHGKHEKHDKHDKSSAAVSTAGAMQKSKSSSSVMHHGSRLMAKKIFRSRSKSQTRSAHAPCNWTPQGSCVWNNVSGRQVVLSDTSLLHLSEVERKVLQKVAIAKLQALNLGVSVKVPSDNVGSVVKPKRRPYLLKRKALTTGIFDTNRKDSDKEKDGNAGGLVFGIPLTQCVENDRITRAAAGSSPFRSRAELAGVEEQATIQRHGSRSSFSSLIDRTDERGSCENLMLRGRMVGSVPGLLDAISCGSTADIPASSMEEESAVPNILTECFRHLEQHGLHTLGIFRVSTSKKRIRQLREDFDCGKETTLEDEQCPHDVATLLKEYLRDLPDPLLCRDLYHAFVQTQRIRNRRLQFEALQHLVQLLPAANRDTLYALLSFLAIVAKYSNDSQDESGEPIIGNKMDSSNLATVFAPNILHCIKPGSKDTADRPEDRIDIINVVRTLIDHYKIIFSVSAELLDEVYVHMMDTHPEALDQLLSKKDAVGGADESVDELDSESNSAPWTPTIPTSEMSIENTDGRGTLSEPKKTYSREEFLHEAAATGGPNVGMRIRHKDKIRERSTRRRREKNEDGTTPSSAISIISRFRGQKEDDNQYGKTRSSSIESTSSTHTDTDVTRVLRIADDSYERRKSSPYVLDNSGVITASLTIPVHTQNQSLSYNVDDDIPYIEDVDNARQQITVGVVRTPTAPPRRRNHSIVQSYDSAVGSSATYSSPVQNTPTSVSSSIADAGTYSSPPSWASTPPTSPDSVHTSVNYIPDDIQPPRILSKSSKSVNLSKEAPPTLQKVSFSSVQEVQQIKEIKEPQKVYQRELSYTKQKLGTSTEVTRSSYETSSRPSEPKFTPSISNIGNAVLRSKTADFERIIKIDTNKPKSPVMSAAEREKKKYTKRRYTDSRHQTRHIPDAEALESASAQAKKDDKLSSSQAGPVYKRRELISSVPSK
ncbi:uncharacterized protein LOC108917763 isoform X2 [Anoplophora glabripennis]|uniref:uncharacterized protein LOC108917763 isoform X2 n=1 Tax=Anoplophora glabripennis TaxID=217634 RepID=UPI000874F6F6|nr:uncharacterized protein LOC108917763 isoform X2 [Anoplophora glabripennis]